MGLLWVTLLHPFQDGNGSIGVFLRSLDVPGGELLGVLAGGLATGRNPDGSGHRNGVGGVELAVGLVDVDGDLEDGPQDLGAPVGVGNAPRHHRVVDEGGNQGFDEHRKVLAAGSTRPDADVERGHVGDGSGHRLFLLSNDPNWTESPRGRLFRHLLVA